MAAMDDAINGLSYEELDLLNSDPKMLADFKSKYANQPSPSPKFYELEKQQGVPPTVGGQLQDLAQTYKEAALNPMPGSLIAAPFMHTQKVAGELGADVTRALQPSQGIIPARIGGFAASTAVNPLSYMGGALGPEAEAAGEVPKAGLLTKILNLFKKSPTPEDVADSVGKVQDMMSTATDKFGNMLNKAKEGLGLPTSVEDKAASIRKYGNAFNLDTTQPLKLKESLASAQKAPNMTGEYGTAAEYQANEAKQWTENSGFTGKENYAKLAPSGALTKEIPNANPDIPPQEFRYAFREPNYSEGGELKKSANLPTDTPHPLTDKFYFTKDVPELKIKAGSQTSMAEIKNQYGYDLGSEAQKIADINSGKISGMPNTKPMAYQIGDHAKPTDLVSEIENFKQNIQQIAPSDKVKAASYLQDQINNHVDWNKQGDATQGVLKQQYKDLKDIINNTTTDLQGSKSKMSEVLNTLQGLQGKMQDPGQTEQFLRRIANNPTGKNADYLDKLRKLEGLTGQETVDELFKKFAAQKPLDLSHPISGPIKAGLQNIGSITRNIPRMGIGPAEALRQAGFPLSQENQSELQSLRDRLKNNDNSAEGR